MQPAFQVINFSCDVLWLVVVVVLDVVWVFCGRVVWGWYPMTGRVHLVSSCKMCGGICGNSFFSVSVVMSSPLAIFVLMCV